MLGCRENIQKISQWLPNYYTYNRTSYHNANRMNWNVAFHVSILIFILFSVLNLIFNFDFRFLFCILIFTLILILSQDYLSKLTLFSSHACDNITRLHWKIIPSQTSQDDLPELLTSWLYRPEVCRNDGKRWSYCFWNIDRAGKYISCLKLGAHIDSSHLTIYISVSSFSVVFISH